jgi:hypothetical protein
MPGGTRFDDLTPDEMVAFVNEARRHAEFDPLSVELEPENPDVAPVWLCKRCASEHPIDDMIVVEGEPHCPRCDAEGWQYIIPLAAQLNLKVIR